MKRGVYWDKWPMLQYLSHQSILDRHTSLSGLKAYILEGLSPGTLAEIAIKASGITRPLKCGGCLDVNPLGQIWGSGFLSWGEKLNWGELR